MCSVVTIIDLILNIYGWILIVYVVAGLLMAFGVINPYNRFVNTVYEGLQVVCEPVLRPIRQFLVRLFGGSGALDFSPLVVFLIIIFLRLLLAEYAFPAACVA